MKAKAKPKRAPEPRVQASYLLPERLIAAVKHDAVKRGCWPARIIEEMVAERYGQLKRPA